MSITSNLDPVRYFSALDPYNWKIDNRPLVDLRSNIDDLASEADQNIASRNLLSLAVGEVLAASRSGFGATGTVHYINPITSNPFALNYDYLVLSQEKAASTTDLRNVPKIGVLRSNYPNYIGIVEGFSLPSGTFTARTFLVEARIKDYDSTSPYWSGPLCNLSDSNHVGGIEFHVKQYPTDQPAAPKEDPLYPSVTSGWVDLHRVVLYDNSISIQHNINVIDMNFHRRGLIDAGQLVTMSVDTPELGMSLVLGKTGNIVSPFEHTQQMSWRYVVPVPPGPGKALVSTDSQAFAYEWQDYTPGGGSGAGDPIAAGTVMMFAMGAIPSDYLECDGSVKLRDDYPHLFAAIGTTYNTTGETVDQFRLPDYRGMFIRGWDHGRGIDAGRVFPEAAYQEDMFESHRHDLFINGTNGGNNGVGAMDRRLAGYGTDTMDNTLNYAADTGGTETRPKNMAAVFAIKHTVASSVPVPPVTPIQAGFPVCDTTVDFLGPVAAYDEWLIPNGVTYLEVTAAGGGGGGGAGGVFDTTDGTGGGGGAAGQLIKFLLWDIPAGSKLVYYVGDGGAAGVVNSGMQSGGGGTGGLTHVELQVPNPDTPGSLLTPLVVHANGGGGGTGGWKGSNSGGGVTRGVGGNPSPMALVGTNWLDFPSQDLMLENGGSGSSNASHGAGIVAAYPTSVYGTDGFRSMISKPHPTSTSKYAVTYPVAYGANTDTPGADGQLGGGGGGGYGGTTGQNGGKGGLGILRIRY